MASKHCSYINELTQGIAGEDPQNRELQERLAAEEAARQRAEAAQRSAAQDAEHQVRRLEARHEAQLEVTLRG